MAETPTFDELCDDARAYLRIGEMESAVAVLFEGLAPGAAPEAAAGVETAVGNLCRSLWTSRDLEGANRVVRAAVREIVKRGEPVEPEFLERYAVALAETGASPFPMRRLYRQRNLLNIFRRVLEGPEGDIAECGCARGLSSLQLCLAFAEAHPGWRGESFHVFDSFEGLSAPDPEDAVDLGTAQGRHVAANMAPGVFAVPREVVERNLHRLFPAVTLHAGWIPQVFAGEPDRRYRFVHVDVDLYRPTLESLRYFFPKLERGGIVLSDDYEWPGARKAFDDFARENGLELQTTETSQAFFVSDGAR